MNKISLTLIIAAMNIVFFDHDCIGAAHAIKTQPAATEIKQLERSLELFSKKIVAKNKVVHLQYKRYGKQAVLSFDIIKPTEALFMLYLLEYHNGDWRISKEYHYSKTVVSTSANLC